MVGAPSELGAPGLRARKKLATRTALRVAALRLVASRGLAHVTVEEIAEAAEVSTRTFFNYFPSKEAAVVGYDPDRLERFTAHLRRNLERSTPFGALVSALVDQAAETEDEVAAMRGELHEWRERLKAVRSDPHLQAAFLSMLVDYELAAATCIESHLAGHADAMGPPRSHYARLLAATALAAARAAAISWSQSPPTESLGAATARALEQLGSGFGHCLDHTADHEGSRP